MSLRFPSILLSCMNFSRSLCNLSFGFMLRSPVMMVFGVFSSFSSWLRYAIISVMANCRSSMFEIQGM